MATSVAVLGTGIMGSGMARNLLSAGLDVRVWNRAQDKARPLAEDGATVADAPEQAAGGAEIVLTMLLDADTTNSVLRDGALAATADGAVWVQSGTVGIDGSAKLAELAGAHGITYVDAPVLGTKQPAEDGQLVVLASGPDEAREPTHPVFDAIGKKTMWVGAAGAGSRLKLVTNDWIIGLLATLGETLALAEHLGVDPADFLGAIEGGPLDSSYAQLKSQLMRSGDYPASFPLSHLRKDAALVAEAADGLPMSVTDAAGRYVDAAIEAGHGDDDMAAIFEGARRRR